MLMVMSARMLAVAPDRYRFRTSVTLLGDALEEE